MKRIIAKEILIILGVCVLTAIVYFSINIRNKYYVDKVLNLSEEKRKADEQIRIIEFHVHHRSMNYSLNERFQEFKEENFLRGSISDKEIQKAFPDIKNVELVRNYLIASDTSSDLTLLNLSFPEIFDITHEELDTYLILKEKSQRLPLSMDKLARQLLDEYKLTMKFFFYIVSIVFGLRYLIYLTKWALKNSR